MLRRPFVSARNPHKCDEQMMPKKPMAFNTPFSAAVNFKSHSDTGKTKLMPHVSIKTAFKIKPLKKIIIKLKIPNSVTKKSNK